jgi:hypothetical protein
MRLSFVTFCLALLLTSSAFADEVITITKATTTGFNGWYSGGSLGTSEVDRVTVAPAVYSPTTCKHSFQCSSPTPVSASSGSDRELAFRIYGGRTFYDETGVGLGFELGFASLTPEVDAIDLTAVFSFPIPFNLLTNTDILLRGGFASWDAGVNQSDQDYVFAAGISRSLTSSDLRLRLEYVSYRDIKTPAGEQNIPMITVGVENRF